MTGRDLLATPGSWSVHQLGVADLISTLALIATKPQDIVVLGIQPAHTDWGATLSPEVEAALAPLVDAALKQLLMWQQIKADNMHMKPSLTNPAPGAAITDSANKGGD